MSATTLLGKVMITPRGAYNSATAYVALDAITYNGSSFLALSSITGITPVDDGVNYQLLSKAGAAFLAASGTPTSGTGNDGDTYLDDVSGLLYGPKSNGAWPGSPVDISDAVKKDLASTSAGEGSALVGFIQSGAGAVARTVQDKSQENKTIQDFGGIADGSTDFSGALTLAKAAGVKRLRLPAGAYKLTNAVDISGMSLFGDGIGNTVVDATAVTGATVFSGSGSLTAIAGSLSVATNEGDLSITLTSVDGLSVDDILLIYNPTASSWLSSRTYYNAGEFCEIAQITGNVLTLKNHLYDSYATTAVTLYKVSRSDVGFSGMSVSASAALAVFQTTLCRTIASDLSITHANSSCISLSNNFGSNIARVTTNNAGGSTGTEYGVVVGNSQDITVDDCFLYSERHAFASGGGSNIGNVPNRNIRVRNSTLKNNKTLSLEAGNFHGNIEDSGFYGCTLYGGVGLGGRNVSAEGCTIYSRNDGVCVTTSEIKGGRFSLRDNAYVTYLANTAFRGIIDVGGNSTGAYDACTVLPFTLDVSGGSLFGRNLTSGNPFVKIINHGSLQPMNVRVHGLVFDINALEEVLNTNTASGASALAGYFVVDHLAGLPSRAKYITHSDAGYATALHRVQKQQGVWSSATSTSASNVVSAGITFTHPYPKLPTVTLALMGSAGVATGTVGGKVGVAGVYALTNSTIRPKLYSSDNANFTAVANFDMQWTAELNEV